MGEKKKNTEKMESPLFSPAKDPFPNLWLEIGHFHGDCCTGLLHSSLARGRNTRLSTMKTKKNTEKEERTTGELDKETWRPLVLNGKKKEKAHFSIGKGAGWGNYCYRVGFMPL